MGLVDLLPLFAQTGVTGVIVWVLHRFFLSAVEAHKQRADAAERAAAAAEKRADERHAQLMHILSVVKTAASDTAASP